MNLDLLKSRLHIDQVQLWNEVVQILQESRFENYQQNEDFTREYYIGLISKILEEFQKEVPKYSKSVQTEHTETDSVSCEFLEEMEKSNKMLVEYHSKINNLLNYSKGDDTLSKVCLDEDNFLWNSSINLLKHMKFQENREFIQKFLEVLEKREELIRNVISSQHSMLMLLKDINWIRKYEETNKYKMKTQEYEDSIMKKEIEELKSQNERLNLRIGLYQSEISRLLNKKESSYLEE